MKRALIIALFLCSLVWAEVTAEYSPVSYACDGADTTFEFTWDIWNSVTTHGDLVVTLIDSNGTSSILTENSDYTVSATNDDFRESPGGTVTTTETYAAGNTIVLSRRTDVEQESNMSPLRPSSLKNSFDLLTLMVQENREMISRKIGFYVDGFGEDCNLAPEDHDETGYPYWNGSSWNVANPSSSSVATTSFSEGVIATGNLTNWVTALGGDDAVKTALDLEYYDIDHLPIFDVNDYGATGDGVTDDTTAILAANTAAGTSGVVYFPPGQYIITASIPPSAAIYQGVSGRGTGSEGSLLIQSTLNEPVFEDNDGLRKCIFRDLAIRATANGVYAFASSSVAHYWDSCVFENIDIWKSCERGYSIMPLNCQWLGGRCGYLGTMRNGTWTAFKIQGKNPPDAAACVNNYVRGTWLHGAEDSANAANGLMDLQDNIINWTNINVIFEGTETPAIYAEGAVGLVNIACHFETRQDQGAGEDYLVLANTDGSQGTRVFYRNCYFNLSTASDATHVTELGSASFASYTDCLGNLDSGYFSAYGAAFDDVHCINLWGNQVTNYSGSRNQYGDSYNGMDSETIAVKEVDLSNANIKALAATPIELVAAQGADTLIEIVSCVLVLDYSGGALAEPSAPDDLAIEYDDGSGAQIATWDTTAFITAGADTIERVNVGSIAAFGAAANVNKNVVLINTGGEYTGAGSTSELRVIVNYRVHRSLGL